MIRFTKQISLFGEVTIMHYDAIAGRPVITETTEEKAEATKLRLTREALVNLCQWFYQNRVGAYDFMLRSAPHKIAPQFKKDFAALTAAVNRLQEHTDIQDLATFVHFNIYPQAATLAPRRQDQKTERYNTLLNEMDQIICSVIYQESGNILEHTKGEKAPIF